MNVARQLSGIALLPVLLGAHLAHAQVDSGRATDEGAPDAKEVEEIIVRPEPRAGDPSKIDARYEDILRTRLFSEFRLLREEQERERFRETLPKPVKTGRIRWGYDPAAELQMRRDFEMTKLDGEPPRAPTLFRFEF